MKKIMLAIGALSLAAFTIWWLTDVPLDNAAKQWLAATPSKDNPAYTYLLGFGVPAAQSPSQQGRTLLQRQKNHPDLALPNHYRSLSDSPLLCKTIDASCLLNQQKNRRNAEALISQHQFLIDRYRTFIGFPYFSDNTPYILNATFPDYQLLLAASRLQSLRWAISNNPGEALGTEIHELRRWLTQDHSLISKLIANAILTEKLQLAALLTQQQKIAALTLSPLTQEEKSFQSPFMKEFSLMATFFLDEHYWQGSEGTVWSEKIRFSVGMKKKMTVNRMLPLYQHLSALSAQPVSAIKTDNFQIESPSFSQRIRNPIGNILLDVGGPNFKDYLLRLVHLDAQIQLMKHLDRGTQNDPVTNNPWTPGKKDTLTRKEQQLCFATAPHSDHYSSCLPLL